MKYIFIMAFLCIGLLSNVNAQKIKVTPAAEKAFIQNFLQPKKYVTQ